MLRWEGRRLHFRRSRLYGLIRQTVGRSGNFGDRAASGYGAVKIALGTHPHTAESKASPKPTPENLALFRDSLASSSKLQVQRLTMSGFLSIQGRQIGRGSAALAAILGGLWRHRELPADASRVDCARWLHDSCARAMRAVDLQIVISGALPQHGLIVSNHLSYLDIPALGAALPCVFVSKAEVGRWPLIGHYARWAGSVFVHRHDRADAARANATVADALHNGVPVVLFPEGTTTDGRRVLRFHSTMLQPAIDAAAPVTPCAIHYELEDGNPAREVCWWGKMTLLPHVWNLLGKRIIRVHIAFGETMPANGDRKRLGARLHASVLCLYQRLAADSPGRGAEQG